MSRYYDEVSGIGLGYDYSALYDYNVVQTRVGQAGSDLALLPEALALVHPRRANYLGRDALTAIGTRAMAEATRYRLTSSSDVVAVAFLLFTKGSGFVEDPRLDWASGAISNETSGAAGDAGTRLHGAVTTYLSKLRRHDRPGQV